MWLLLLLACWGGVDHAQREQAWRMGAHWDAASAARDAVVRGDLDAARAQGQVLAELEGGAGFPAELQVHLDGVRDGGKALHGAGSIAQAARATVELTSHCAACHAARGIQTEAPARVPKGPMQAHVTASEQMFTALVWADAARYHAGAEALAAAPLDVEEGSEDAARLARLRELAKVAGDAEADDMRRERYGLMLEACAGCHAAQ